MGKTFVGVAILAGIAAMVYDITKKGSQGASELGTGYGVVSHVFSDITGK